MERCGLCEKEFSGATAELEYMAHLCAVTGHRPTDPEHSMKTPGVLTARMDIVVDGETDVA